MVDTEGKILIGEDGLIKQAADGHGGIYESLVKCGMTEKMRRTRIMTEQQTRTGITLIKTIRKTQNNR